LGFCLTAAHPDSPCRRYAGERKDRGMGILSALTRFIDNGKSLLGKLETGAEEIHDQAQNLFSGSQPSNVKTGEALQPPAQELDGHLQTLKGDLVSASEDAEEALSKQLGKKGNGLGGVIESGVDTVVDAAKLAKLEAQLAQEQKDQKPYDYALA